MSSPESRATVYEVHDKWIQKFLAHLAADRGASVYTQRNYRQALKELAASKQSSGTEIDEALFLRDVAILETIYSCGLRISELCGLVAEDIHWGEQMVRVRGKGKKERLVPIGAPALAAIQNYWNKLAQPPSSDLAVFMANTGKLTPMYPRLVQLRLK